MITVATYQASNPSSMCSVLIHRYWQSCIYCFFCTIYSQRTVLPLVLISYPVKAVHGVLEELGADLVINNAVCENGVEAQIHVKFYMQNFTMHR